MKPIEYNFRIVNAANRIENSNGWQQEFPCIVSLNSFLFDELFYKESPQSL